MAGAQYYATAMDLLAQREAGADWDALAAQVGWQRCSVEKIVSRARRGLITPPGTPRKGGWSPAADDLLAHHWETHNSTQIAALLSGIRPGTTAGAVNGRARRLGLEKPTLYGNHCEWWTKNREAYQ